MRLVVSGERKIAEKEAVKKAYLWKVNEMVGEARKNFITPITGQEMIYLGKEEEAKRFVNSSPLPESFENFPLISAEVGITAEDGWQLSQIWLFMSGQWKQIAAVMESLRLTSLAEMNLAETKAERDEILENLQNALNNISE